MAITKQDIIRKRGDDRRHIFQISDDSGAIVDISGWTTFLMTVDPSPVPEDNTANVDSMSGTYMTDGTDGLIFFVPDQTVPVNVYFYDCQAIDDNGEKITFAEGKYQITQDITKA